MISQYSIQGPRPYQEDRLVTGVRALSDGTRVLFLAVFDGHGGSKAASLAADRFPNIFRPLLNDDIENELKRSLGVLANDLRFTESGTTASVAVISTTKVVTVAIIGDSPVIILDDSGRVNISPEHNVRTNVKEADAAIRRGGRIMDGYLLHPIYDYGLQMTRALGDSEMKQFILSEPEIYRVRVDSRSAVLVASDGLIDPAHSGENNLTNVVTALKNGKTATELVQMVEQTEPNDNVSAIVWRPNDSTFDVQ